MNLLPVTLAALLPEQQQALRSLAHADAYIPAALVVTGLLMLLFGFKAAKAIVMLNGIALGAYLGSKAAAPWHWGWLGAIIGGILFALVCWPFMKFATAAVAGGVGAVVGLMVWAYFQQPAEMRWAGAVMGILVLGMLTFILAKASIILFSSLEGAALLALGGAALLERYGPFHGTVYSRLNHQPLLLPGILLALAVAGFLFQTMRHGLTDAGKGGGDKPAKKAEKPDKPEKAEKKKK